MERKKREVPAGPEKLPAEVSEAIAFFNEISSRKGPRPEDDERLFHAVGTICRSGLAKGWVESAMSRLRRSIPLSYETLQGLIYLRPKERYFCHEYFDRIYRNYHSCRPETFHWDRFWQGASLSRGFREIKTRFIEESLRLFGDSMARRKGRSLRILKLGIGSGREVQELLDAISSRMIHVTCVEKDGKARANGEAFCWDHRERIHWIEADPAVWTPETCFDFIWIGGEVQCALGGDYSLLVERCLSMLGPSGELVAAHWCLSDMELAYLEFLGCSMPDGILDPLRFQTGSLVAPNESHWVTGPSGVVSYFHLRIPSMAPSQTDEECP